MAGVLSMLVSSILQVIVFLLIPFIWWLITARKSQNFFAWLGWRKPESKNPARLWSLAVGVFVLFGFVGVWLLPLMAGKDATSEFQGLGVAGLLPVVIFALAKTAFAEESLFRGFLLKRVAAKFGFAAGNTVQAVVFGLLHALPFGAMAGPLAGLAAGLFSALIGAAMGYLNEREAGGSILPGWIIHAASNLVSGGAALFS